MSAICTMPLSEAMRRALLIEAANTDSGRKEWTKEQLDRIGEQEAGSVGLRENGTLVAWVEC